MYCQNGNFAAAAALINKGAAATMENPPLLLPTGKYTACTTTRVDCRTPVFKMALKPIKKRLILVYSKPCEFIFLTYLKLIFQTRNIRGKVFIKLFYI